MNDTEFQTIDSCNLDDVTGGRGGGLVRAGKWLWNKADRAMTAWGVYEAGQAVYDWATGGNRQQPQQPQTPPQSGGAQ
jgi:hypothetical protein